MTFREIEPLAAKHDKLRDAFTCGSEPLDRYLKQQASQDLKSRAAVPYVLVTTDNRIAGYYTLTSDAIRADGLPTDKIKQLKLPRYPIIGATLLGRLARDLSFRGCGVGELLLVDALRVSFTMSRRIASAAVVVDAKDEHAIRFYSAFGFLSLPETSKRLFLPMRTVQTLFAGEES